MEPVDPRTSKLLNYATAFDLTVGCPLRVALRSLKFLSGDFARLGMRDARAEWKTKRALSLIEDKKLKKRYFYLFSAKQILVQGGKQLAKIATYPIATLGLIAMDLKGLACKDKKAALLKRAEIEAFFSSSLHFDSKEPITFKTSTYKDQGKQLLFQASEVLTPCMLSKENKEAMNIYALIYHHNRQTLRSTLLRLKKMLSDGKPYFKQELKGNFDEVWELVLDLKEHAKLVSSDDYDETDANSGVLVDDELFSPGLKEIRELVWELEDSLLEIQKIRLDKKVPSLDRLIAIKETLLFHWSKTKEYLKALSQGSFKKEWH